MTKNTITEDARSSSQTTADSYVPSRPFLTAMAVGYSFLALLTASLYFALLVSRDTLRAEPPSLGWPFATVLLGGMSACATLQLIILYSCKAPGFWPKTWKEWLQRTGPALLLVATAVLPGLMQAWNATIAIAGTSMLISVAVGMVPTMLCFADWLKHRVAGSNETIQLHLMDKLDLPKSVRAHFDRHTDELQRMGFEKLGDYRLKKYTPTYTRFFLNRERHTFAELSCVTMGFFPLKAVCFFSITPDGHYLESSNARWGKKHQTRFFEMQILPHRPNQEVYDLHLQRLSELEQGEAMSLSVANLESVIRYGNKRLYEVLIANGWASENPYADFDESALIPSRHGAVDPLGDTIFESPIEDMSMSI